MKKILLVAVVFILGLSMSYAKEIRNSTYRVIYSEGKLSILNVNDGKDFLLEFVMGNTGPNDKVKTGNIIHPVWGKGKEMVITEKSSGNLNKLFLFETLPFIMMQRINVNNSDKELIISKDVMLEAQVSIDGSAESLKTMSTAGLKPITCPAGGYVYMAIGDPVNYSGLVCGWLTNQRGSGIVFSDYQAQKAVLRAAMDYGDLHVPVGKSVESEILVIGLWEDVRIGLQIYGDAIARHLNITLPPKPAVYCTWYHARASDEKKIVANTDFVAEYLKSHGLNVMQIDDYWQAGESKNGPNKDFTKADPEGPYPGGMKATANYIRNKGLIPGIWYIPFAGTWYDLYWADKQDMFLKGGNSEFNFYTKSKEESGTKMDFPKGEEPYVVSWGGTCLDLTNPKTQQYVQETAARMSHEWGYKYFKMDAVWTGTATRIQYVNSEYKDDDLGMQTRFNTTITPIEAYAKGLDIIRDAAGEDVFLLGCSQTQNMRSFGAAMGRVDAMRVGPDNGANPEGLVKGPMFSNRLFFLNNRVWYNDPDPVYVRVSFPEEMAKSSVSWTSLTGSLHSSSYQYGELPPERLDILKRSLPSHNLKTVQPIDFLEADPARVWLLTDDREGTRRDVLGLFNWDVKKPTTVSQKLINIKLPEADHYVGFDFWGNKFIPKISDSISVHLPPGGCKIISIRPAASHPQLISTSRHLRQGVIDLKEENWNGKNRILSGKSSVIGGEVYELRIVIPEGSDNYTIENVKIIDSSQQAEVSYAKEKSLVRVKVSSPENQNVKWAIQFNQ